MRRQQGISPRRAIKGNLLQPFRLDRGTRQCFLEGPRRDRPVHWYFGHLRFRDLRKEQLRAIVHQLRQRETTTDLHPIDAQGGARRVRARADQVDAHQVFRQQDCVRFDRGEAATGCLCCPERRLCNSPCRPNRRGSNFRPETKRSIVEPQLHASSGSVRHQALCW